MLLLFQPNPAVAAPPPSSRAVRQPSTGSATGGSGEPAIANLIDLGDTPSPATAVQSDPFALPTLPPIGGTNTSSDVSQCLANMSESPHHWLCVHFLRIGYIFVRVTICSFVWFLCGLLTSLAFETLCLLVCDCLRVKFLFVCHIPHLSITCIVWCKSRVNCAQSKATT